MSIKVDREERPDLDQVYMAAVQAMTGGGGWPMSVFLTPDGQPFYGGTYYPDEPRHGMPSFRQVLEGVERAWREERAEVEAAGGRIVDGLVEQARLPATTDDPSEALLEAATAAIEASFDPGNGGWGRAPKFPQPMTIEYLLRRHLATGDARPLAIARRSLDAMADGGIHDQLGGGFHRYSTDARWLVPHFEQMLYDNAQLARVYIHAWQVTGDERYREVATGTLDYMIRELHDRGRRVRGEPGRRHERRRGRDVHLDRRTRSGPCSADDSPALRGGVWRHRCRQLGGRDDPEPGRRRRRAGRAVRRLAGRDRRAAPSRARPTPRASRRATAAGSRRQGTRGLERARDRGVRRRRRRAGRDRSGAGGPLPRGRHARGRGDRRGTPRDRTVRSVDRGRTAGPSGAGVLEDYTHLADGLLALYEATFDERWFTTARALMDQVLARFADPDGGFFDTSDRHERLVTRPKDVQDNAVPSGNAMAATVLLRLHAWTGESGYRTAAERAMRLVVPFVARYPTGFAQWLTAMDLSLRPITEVAIVGRPDDPATAALVAETRRGYRPNQVVAVAEDAGASAIPLLGRSRSPSTADQPRSSVAASPAAFR